jgi:hypothetical protein
VAIGKTKISSRQEPRQHPKRVRSRRPALARADEGKAEPISVSAGDEDRQQEQTAESGSQDSKSEQVPEGQAGPAQSE